MIETSCPRCGKQYRLKPEMAGRKARCRNCSTTFLVEDVGIGEAEVPLHDVDVSRQQARPARGGRTMPSPASAVDFSAGHEADDEDFDHDGGESAVAERRSRRSSENSGRLADGTSEMALRRLKANESARNTEWMILAAGGLCALSVCGALFWLVFMRGSESPGPAAPATASANGEEDLRSAPGIVKEPAGQQVAAVAREGENPLPGGSAKAPNAPGAPIGSKEKPTIPAGDRLAVFRMPGDLPYGKSAATAVDPNAAPSLKSLDRSAFNTITSCVEELETLVEFAKSATDEISVLKVREMLNRRFENNLKKFERMNETVSRTTKIENGAIQAEFSNRLATAVRRLQDESKRVAAIPGQNRALIDHVDKMSPLLARFETYTKDKVAPDTKDAKGEFLASAYVNNSKIDPVKEPNFAEVRIAGLDSEEGKSLVAKRLNEVGTHKKSVRLTWYEAPYRIVIWPVDSIDELASKIDFGEVLHTEGKEVWVWAMPLAELRAQRTRLDSDLAQRKASDLQKFEEDRKRNAQAEIDARAKSDRDAEALLEQVSGEASAHMNAITGGRKGVFGPITSESTPKPSKESGSMVAIASLGGPRRPAPAGGNAVKAGRPRASGSPAAPAAGTEKANPSDTVDIALVQLKGGGSGRSKALATLAVIDLEGREKEIAITVGQLLSDPKATFDTEAILAVLDRCPGPERIEFVTARLNGKLDSTTDILPALARWKDPLSIEPLAEQLGSLTTRREVSRILISFGQAAEKAVLKQAADPDVFTRNAAWEILGEIGGNETISIVRSLGASGLSERSAEEAVSRIRERKKRRR